MNFKEKTKKILSSIKIESGILTSVLIMALLSFFCVMFQAVGQNGVNARGYLTFLTSPVIVVFNFIPVFLVMLFIYCLTNRVWVSFLLTDLVLNIALFINHYKVVFRAEAFKFSDIILAGEAFNITKNYSFGFSLKLFVVFLMSFLLFVCVLAAVKNKKTPFLKRGAVLLLDVLLMAGAYLGIYQNKALYDSLPSFAGDYNEVSLISNKGLVYSFLVGIKDTGYEKPDGYSVSEYYNILDKYDKEDKENKSEYKPNIIGIMSEAFFDMEECEKAEFYPGMKPLENMRRLRSEGVYGSMIVPGFAGSTASTEFEFLSGDNISLISKTMPSVYNSYIHKPLYCLPQYLKSQGYDTLAIHPGHNWFYNRESVYAKMGFDDFITLEDLPGDIKKINYYTADSETSKLIIDNYKKHLETSSKPYFNFTVTIQNHGPYNSDETFDPPRYVKPSDMTNDMYYIINNYTEGLANADALLGEVMDYINTVDKPTYLVFFGDHLPYLDSEYKGYEYLGYDVSGSSEESIIKKYKIPYVMCANNAAKEYEAQNGLETKKGEQELISSNFLTGKFLDFTNMSVPAYYRFTNEVEKSVSVISPIFYIENGKFTENLSSNGKKLINEYAICQYKNLKEYEK